MAEADIFITADASQAEAELARFQAQWRASMATITGGIGDTARRVAIAGGIAFAGQAAVVGIAIGALRNYEFALRQTAVIGGLTETQMWELNDAINVAAASWGVAGDEIAQGALILAKAGLTGREIIDIIDVATQAVLANGISWETAARAYVVATTAFAAQGLTAVEVFDKLQVAANISLLDVEDFGRAFGFAAGTIQLAGGTMEEFLALMVQLVNAGQQAGISARGIDQMIVSLIQNADQAQAWADSLGLGVNIIEDGRLNLLALVEAFDRLDVSIDVDQLAEFFGFMERRGARALAFLLLNADRLPGSIDAITNSQGALAEVAGETADTLQSQWQQVVQTFVGGIRTPEVVEALSDVLTELKDIITASAPVFREILVTVIRDFAANLPQLLELLQGLLRIVVNMLPVWNAFSQVFLGLVKAFLSLPQPVQNMIILFALFNRILPIKTILDMVAAFGKLRLMMATQLVPTMGDVDNWFNTLNRRAVAMRAAMVGVGAAVSGVALMMAAMSATSKEQAALYSVLTAAAWGLAAAQFAVALAEISGRTLFVGTIPAIAIMAAALAGVGTYIAATAGKSFQEGTPFVEETGMYRLHLGERVLTAEENRELMDVLANLDSRRSFDALLSGLHNLSAFPDAFRALLTSSENRSLQMGTDFVTETGAFMLHRGERVLTAEENRGILGFRLGMGGAGAVAAGTTISGGMHGGTLNFNFYDASRDDISKELARFGL